MADLKQRREGKSLEARLEIRNDIEDTLRELLRSLLEQEICDALLVPGKLPDGSGVAPALLQDAELIDQTRPLAPVLPVSEATLLGRLTRGERSGTLGAVLHPCQVRAYIELVKLQQARRDDVFLISVDCPGTYEVKQYAELARGETETALEPVRGLREGAPAPHDGYDFREACRMCERPLPHQADLRVKIVGVADEGELRLRAAADVLARLGLSPTDSDDAEDEAERRLLQSRTAERDRLLELVRAQMQDVAGLEEQFSTCIRCLNCMDACPLCYCKECIFRTETFEHRPADYSRWAARKGAVRLPADTLLFHMTRLNHMVTSCVGCGLCDSACPSGLPIARLFRAVGQEVQGIFDYVPGRDSEEEIPIATFREDELKEV